MVKFKEVKIENVLNWQSQIEINPLKLNELSVTDSKKYPFYGQSTTNNGIIGYFDLDQSVLNNINSLRLYLFIQIIKILFT